MKNYINVCKKEGLLSERGITKMKIAIIGGFGYKHVNGQTIKTNNLCELLRDEEITKIDSSSWKKHPISLIHKIRTAFRQCECIIMLPAHRGVKIFSPLLTFYKRRFKKRIYYDVIGGWLPKYLDNNKRLLKHVRKFDGILVETNTMKKKLRVHKLDNVFVVPNYKQITPLKESSIKDYNKDEIKLCTFSRVSKEKGIVDIIKAINELNLRKKEVFLDIYGPVETDFLDEFNSMIAHNKHVKYCGIIESNKSVDIIKNYYMLCFPTKFFTEGIPGTIIDSYCAGVPVLSSSWESAQDIITDGKTGILYNFNNYNSLLSKLEYCIDNITIINSLKRQVLQESLKYSYEKCYSDLMRCLYGNK